MDKEALFRQRRDLLEKKEELQAALETAEGAERRCLRVELAKTDERILACQDQLRQIKRDEGRAEKRSAVRKMAASKQADREAEREAMDQEAAYLADILRRLDAAQTPAGSSLKEIAKSYRKDADNLRHRINLVEESRPKTPAEYHAKQERLRILKEMRRDVREMAVICERHYKHGYKPNERYVIS